MIDLGQLLESSGAILHGHFLLTSGRHSDVYFEKFRVLEQPTVLTALCSQIANHFGVESESSDHAIDITNARISLTAIKGFVSTLLLEASSNSEERREFYQ